MLSEYATSVATRGILFARQEPVKMRWTQIYKPELFASLAEADANMDVVHQALEHASTKLNIVDLTAIQRMGLTRAMLEVVPYLPRILFRSRHGLPSSLLPQALQFVGRTSRKGEILSETASEEFREETSADLLTSSIESGPSRSAAASHQDSVLEEDDITEFD